MKREIKIWGERWLLRQDSTSATSYLMIRDGYRCSWHRHAQKYNLFVMLEGILEIEVEELAERRVITLCKGDSFTIQPGQWHEFRGKEDARCIEIMYVEYAESDIERKIIGSKL